MWAGAVGKHAGAVGQEPLTSFTSLSKARGLEYILGVRERTAKEVRSVVLGDAGPFVPLVIPRRGRADTELEAKAVTLGQRRYIVCRNPAEAEKDALERAAIVVHLRRALKAGDKALLGNAGYRRFLKAPEVGFAIDEARVAEDARFAVPDPSRRPAAQPSRRRSPAPRRPRRTRPPVGLRPPPRP